MSRISINAGAAARSGGQLVAAAGTISKGASSAMSALGRSGGLPPAFQGRASNLAGRCPSGKLASDCFGMTGFELQTRSQMAIQYDAGGKLGGAGISGLKGVKNPGLSSKWTMWNPQTAKYAKTNPGGLFRDLNYMIDPLAKPPKAKGKSTAGKFECKRDLTWEYGVLAAEMKQKLSPTLQEMLTGKNAKGEKVKVSLADLRKLSAKDFSAAFKIGVTGMAKAECTLDLGKGVKSQILAQIALSLSSSTGVSEGKDHGLRNRGGIAAKGKLGRTGSAPVLSLAAKLEASIGTKALTAFVQVEIKKELELSPRGLARLGTDPKTLKDLIKDGKPTPGLRSNDWRALAKSVFTSPPPPPIIERSIPIGPDYVWRPTATLTPAK